MTGLFGKAGADPNSYPPAGEDFFGKLIYAVQSAADNFSYASNSVKQLFTPFLNMGSSDGGGGTGAVGPQQPPTKPPTTPPSDIIP